jgi:manganese transport protein
LLLGVSLLVGALLTFVLVTLILALERFRFRPHEMLIVALVGVVCVAYVVETVMAQPAWGQVLRGSMMPWIGGRDSMTLAVAIVGATVMPHVLYYHSSLTQGRVRDGQDHWRDLAPAIRRSTTGVIVALAIAGIVNLAMMYVSASTFNAHGATGLTDIGSAYRGLIPILGRDAALIFGIALLASGLSSSVVGTSAGQTIVQDFIGPRIPLMLRRVVTMIPAIAIVVMGVDVTKTLVMSQVVLSLVLPIPLVALVYFTSRRSVMGAFTNRRSTIAAAAIATVFIIGLNIVLIATTL